MITKKDLKEWLQEAKAVHRSYTYAMAQFGEWVAKEYLGIDTDKMCDEMLEEERECEDKL